MQRETLVPEAATPRGQRGGKLDACCSFEPVRRLPGRGVARAPHLRMLGGRVSRPHELLQNMSLGC